MQHYSKIHQEKKAADAHLENIKQRGGIATVKTVKEGIWVDYYFPEGNKAGKTGKRKKYDVISPDGLTIRIGVPPFSSQKERRRYFEQWVKRYERQGYYSSVKYGRIHLPDLEDFCEWMEL